MTGTQTPVGIPDRPVRRGADDVEALRLHGRGEGDQAAVGAGGQPAHLLGPVVGEVDAGREAQAAALAETYPYQRSSARISVDRAWGRASARTCSARPTLHGSAITPRASTIPPPRPVRMAWALRLGT